MGFFQKLFSKKKEEQEHIQADWELTGQEAALLDEEGRRKYLDECILQMREVSDEIDLLNREYDSVTSHLNDMDEIERLPENIMAPILDCAKKISRMEKEREKFAGMEGRMKDSDFAHMERLADEMPEGYEKLKETEEFQKKIHSDLYYLENERQAYLYRQNELKTSLANLKGIGIICMVALVLCVAMLFVLFLGFDMDVRLGFLLAVGVAAVTFFILFNRNNEFSKELKKVEKSSNKLVLIHNATKIRYVNNTNLLEYLYLKYGVDKAKDLKDLWEQYLKEKTEREHYEQMLNDLPLYRDELVRRLSKCPVSDPGIWARQSEALLDHKEMVEIRHAFIERRQNLRKQMDDNRECAKACLDRIKEMIRIYPQYSTEVMKKVEELEKS